MPVLSLSEPFITIMIERRRRGGGSKLVDMSMVMSASELKNEGDRECRRDIPSHLDRVSREGDLLLKDVFKFNVPGISISRNMGSN